MNEIYDGNNRRSEWFGNRTGIILTGLLVFGVSTVFAKEASAGGVEGATLVSGREPLIGAYYYPWYSAEGRHWNEGYFRGKLQPPQKPLLGEYDSRDEAVINQHIQWAKEGGIDFFCMSYWGKDTFGDKTIKNNFAKAKGFENFKFAILYETLAPDLLGPYHGLQRKGDFTFESGNALEQAFVESIEYLAETYFNHPSYLRIDGKPVLILYVTHQFAGDYQGALEKLRLSVRQKHNMELYLVGDEVDPMKPPRDDRIACFDAITPYIQYSSPVQILRDTSLGYADETWILQNARMKNTRFKAISDRLGVGFIPNALPGFNDRGVRLDVDHYYLPHRRHRQDSRPYGLFEDYLQMAGEFMNPDLKLMMITSWNEWHEDTQLEPVIDAAATTEPISHTVGLQTASYGFNLLNILKSFKIAYAGPQTLPPMKPVKITEVCMADGASYIELYNAGDEAIDLNGMRLCLRNRHDPVDRDHLYVRIQGVLPAGGYYLIATPSGYDHLRQKYGVQVNVTIETPKFKQISPDNGQIALRDYHGRIVDAFSWTSGAPFDGDYVEKENLKLRGAPEPNQAMIRRDHNRDQNNSALDFKVGIRSPKK